jgi:peroxiredoxin
MEKMNNILLFTGLCLIIVASTLYGEEKKEDEEAGLSVGNTVPRFIATDIYGKEVNLEKLKGKVVILSIEHFGRQRKSDAEARKKASDFYQAHKKEGLEVIRIASKKGVPFFISKSFVESRARKSLEKRKESWTVIIDWDCSLKKLFQMADEPLVFVIDKLGIIRYKKKGHFIVNKELDELIQKLLKE